jgi:hypothetical protein
VLDESAHIQIPSLPTPTSYPVSVTGPPTTEPRRAVQSLITEAVSMNGLQPSMYLCSEDSLFLPVNLSDASTMSTTSQNSLGPSNEFTPDLAFCPNLQVHSSMSLGSAVRPILNNTTSTTQLQESYSACLNQVSSLLACILNSF